jgi:succinate dehydrogenase (ubiquinone) cytochrome b560 subunit
MSVLNEKEADKVDVFARSRSLHRPISPHFTIYQPQLTWVLSIGSRVTACGLTAALYAGTIAYGLQEHSIDQIATSITQLGLPPIVFLASKTILAWPFTFHSFAGIRHLIWDTGRALSLPGVYRTGKAVIYGSLLATVVLVFL